MADGTLLNYSYDAFGRIERYESSDGTFCYLYTYDPIGNLIRVDDKVNGTPTKRTYDSANRLIAETLGNGLTKAISMTPLDV